MRIPVLILFIVACVVMHQLHAVPLAGPHHHSHRHHSHHRHLHHLPDLVKPQAYPYYHQQQQRPSTVVVQTVQQNKARPRKG